MGWAEVVVTCAGCLLAVALVLVGVFGGALRIERRRQSDLLESQAQQIETMDRGFASVVTAIQASHGALTEAITANSARAMNAEATADKALTLAVDAHRRIDGMSGHHEPPKPLATVAPALVAAALGGQD